MKGPSLGPGGEDITWPDQVAPRGRRKSSTRKVKPQTSNTSGCPLPSPAGTPLHVVCAVGELGRVLLLLLITCLLCVRSLALLRCSRLPPFPLPFGALSLGGPLAGCW